MPDSPQATTPAVYYFDSSGIVKRYVAERGSARVISLCDPDAGNIIATAHYYSAKSPAVNEFVERIERITPTHNSFNSLPKSVDSSPRPQNANFAL